MRSINDAKVWRVWCIVRILKPAFFSAGTRPCCAGCPRPTVAVLVPKDVRGVLRRDGPVLQKDLTERFEHVDVPEGRKRLGAPRSLDASLPDRDAAHVEVHVKPFQRQHLVGPHTG